MNDTVHRLPLASPPFTFSDRHYRIQRGSVYSSIEPILARPTAAADFICCLRFVASVVVFDPWAVNELHFSLSATPPPGITVQCPVKSLSTGACPDHRKLSTHRHAGMRTNMYVFAVDVAVLNTLSGRLFASQYAPVYSRAISSKLGIGQTVVCRDSAIHGIWSLIFRVSVGLKTQQGTAHVERIGLSRSL